MSDLSDMEKDSNMSSCRYHLRSWELWVFGLTVLGMGLVEATLVTAGLYECRNEAGTIIYTDSPAQLERCQPVGSSGPSRLGVVGGASPSPHVTPAAPVPVPPTSTPSSPGSSDPTVGSSAIAPAGVPGGHAEESPCVPGVNPLNPLSAPPCAATSPPVSSPASPGLSPVGSDPPAP
jgi:hypothetical protein